MASNAPEAHAKVANHNNVFQNQYGVYC